MKSNEVGFSRFLQRKGYHVKGEGSLIGPWFLRCEMTRASLDGLWRTASSAEPQSLSPQRLDNTCRQNDPLYEGCRKQTVKLHGKDPISGVRSFIQELCDLIIPCFLRDP